MEPLTFSDVMPIEEFIQKAISDQRPDLSSVGPGWPFVICTPWNKWRTKSRRRFVACVISQYISCTERSISLLKAGHYGKVLLKIHGYSEDNITLLGQLNKCLDHAKKFKESFNFVCKLEG